MQKGQCDRYDSDLQMCVPYLWWGNLLEGLDNRAVLCTGCCVSVMIFGDSVCSGAGCRVVGFVGCMSCAEQFFVLLSFDGDLELSSDGVCHSVLSWGSVS